MAATIHCDAPGEQHPADVMVNMLDGSSAFALCNEHHYAFMAGVVDDTRAAEAAAIAAAAQAEADATDAEAIARIEGAKSAVPVAARRGRGTSRPVDPPASVVGESQAHPGTPADGSEAMTAGPDDDEDDDADEATDDDYGTAEAFADVLAG